MSELPKREKVRRLWFVQERLRRLADERKLLTEQKRKGGAGLDVRQISRMRAYILVRLSDLQQEVATLSEERQSLKAALKSTKEVQEEE